ncbi:hypothetical protein FNU76_20285 [Chitinimonas arctica]|uniref:Type VI secretion system lipoprotein TssJ n=1 Tax=Chitinimonas arctica TaxID=2594795 RepID=A0A516SKF6_9NEIS|nr:hypothetical protein [Chitinimonas arctica]QDQ28508.1 hypothetical protein FNU76_20285 [Chitinimonas arctica]
MKPSIALRQHPFYQRLAGSLLCLVLAACGTVAGWMGWDGPPKAQLRQLRVVAEADANQDSAIRLDLVLVYQQGALSMLPDTAPAWFERKQALLDGMPAGIEVLQLELPPATLIERVALPAGIKRALHVRVYADHRNPKGQHVVELGTSRSVELRLRADDMRFQPLP